MTHLSTMTLATSIQTTIVSVSTVAVPTTILPYIHRPGLEAENTASLMRPLFPILIIMALIAL